MCHPRQMPPSHSLNLGGLLSMVPSSARALLYIYNVHAKLGERNSSAAQRHEQTACDNHIIPSVHYTYIPFPILRRPTRDEPGGKQQTHTDIPIAESPKHIAQNNGDSNKPPASSKYLRDWANPGTDTGRIGRCLSVGVVVEHRPSAFGVKPVNRIRTIKSMGYTEM